MLEVLGSWSDEIWNLFWVDDHRTMLFIGIVISAALLALVLVYLPLWIRLRQARRLRISMSRATRRLSPGTQALRDEVSTRFSSSPLRDHWEEFIRRWRDSRDESDRAPVRFAELFDDRPLMPTGARSSLLPSLPGIFLALGIFGTFVGLTLALPEPGPASSAHAPARVEPARPANELGETEAQIAHLTASLSLAFRTSLWGLVFSVLSLIGVRRLEGNFDAEEERLDQLVHRAFGWISDSELAHRSSVEQRQGTDRLRKELTEVTMELQNALTAGLGEIQKVATSTAESVSEELVEQLARSIQEGVGAHVDALRTAIAETTRSQEQIGEGIALAFEQIREATQAHEATAGRLADAAGAVGAAAGQLESSAGLFGPAVDQLGTAGSALEATAQSLSHTQEATREAVESVRATLVSSTEALDHQRELVEGTLTEMKAAMEQLSQGLSDNLLGALRSIDDVLGSALGRLSGTIRDNNETLDRIGPALGEIQQTAHAVQSTLGGLEQSAQNAGAALRAELEPLATSMNGLRESNTRVSDTLQELMAGLEQASAVIGRTGSDIRREAEPLSKSLAEASTQSANLAQQLHRFDERLANRPTLRPSSPPLEAIAPTPAPPAPAGPPSPQTGPTPRPPLRDVKPPTNDRSAPAVPAPAVPARRSLLSRLFK